MSPDPQQPEPAAPEAPCEPADGPVLLTCPNCASELHVVLGPVARYESCPACGAPFLAPGLDGSTAVPDDEPEESEDEASTRAQFDDVRMRTIVTEKRAAYRSRTYCLLGAFLCGVGAAKLVTLCVAYVKAFGWRLPAAGYVILAVAGVIGAVYLLRRAAYWNRQGQISAFDDSRCKVCGYDLRATPDRCPECGTVPEKPIHTPDFSTLSDGSDKWKSLEQVK